MTRRSLTIIRLTQTVVLISAISAICAAQNTARNGIISGRLLLRNGAPAAEMRILALSADKGTAGRGSGLISVAKTDAQGRYRLEDVPPGRYNIATGPLEALTYFPGIASQSEAAIITVANGGNVAGLDFQLKTVRVSGRVLGIPATPTLHLVPEPGASTAMVATDGSFLFGAVLPGTYRFIASEGVIAGAIVVGDNDVTGIQVKAGRVMNFRVTVTAESGGPTPSFRLRFQDAKPRESPAPFVETVATGSFEVQLPDIQYQMVASELPPGFFVRCATLVYPSGGTTSILKQPFTAHEVARMAIVLGRDDATPLAPPAACSPVR